MARLYLVADGGEIARRRPLLPRGRLVEAWPDLYTRGEFWMSESAKTLLDGAGEPLPAKLELAAAAVPVYYGPRLCDIDSLPAEDSLQTRVLSAHGIAVAWITLDRFGERNQYQAQTPTDPVFTCGAREAAPPMSGASSRHGARRPCTWRNTSAPTRKHASGPTR